MRFNKDRETERDTEKKIRVSLYNQQDIRGSTKVMVNYRNEIQ